MNFEVSIVGSNSAVPAYGRFPSCQLVHIGSSRYMIDCGEGTQFRLSYHKFKRSGLNNIFISHMHGDHYFGLVGLLNTMRMSGRKEAMQVFGPPELEKILELQLELRNPEWGFEILFKPLPEGGAKEVYEDANVVVSTIPLKHKNILCNGFLFREKKKLKSLKPGVVQEYKIPYEDIQAIRGGRDYSNKGSIIPNADLTKDAPEPRSYAYCSDTIYDPDLVKFIENVDMLYHEATFLHDMADKAAARYHSTAQQAAKIAREASVKKLIIGHFSARYKELEPLLEEAKTLFPDTELAIEGKTFNL